MSDEPKYPTAIGIWNKNYDQWVMIFDSEDEGYGLVEEFCDENTPAVAVPMIAREDVDRLIAAERERCAAIADSVASDAPPYSSPASAFFTAKQGAAQEIARRIREVPE
jgi:hypothetical protein